jgi:phosphonate transport system substrate-binding protein
MMRFIFLALLPLHVCAELILAVVPWRSPEALERLYAPLVQIISQSTGQKVRFMVSSNYSQLINQVAEEHADIAIFGANSYVEAKERIPNLIYLGTCKIPNDHYNSILIAHKSNLAPLQSYRGKHLALTDKASTSGYVYPLLMLHEAQIGIEDFATVSLLGSHYRIYEAVANKVIDIGGVSMTGLEDAIKIHGDIFGIIQMSEPIPQDPIVIAPHVNAEYVDALQGALASDFAQKVFDEFQTDLKGVAIHDDAYYDIVRRAREWQKE